MGELLTFGSGLLAGAGASFCAACFLFLYLRRSSRKKMEKTYQQLLTRLDRAMGGQIQETAYDESMDAAVTERLNRVVRISRMHQEKAERERDTIKSLISDISHQAVTPAASVMLYGQLLEEELAAPDGINRKDALEAVRAILEQAGKIDFFMRLLVKLSRLEKDIISVKPKKQCIASVLQALKQQYGLRAAEKNIELYVEDSLELAVFDRKWTIEAAASLVDNALKYTPAGGYVSVRVVPYTMFVRLDVTDNGIGIKEEDQGKIFTRFYRAGAVHEQKGTGIGLYLARKVMGMQDGYMKVVSQEGRGSTFSLFFLRQERMEKNEKVNRDGEN